MHRPACLAIAISSSRALGLAISLSLFAAACANLDYQGTPLAGADAGSSSPTPDPGGDGSCVPKTDPMDPSTLPACCAGVGAAHCVPADKVPASFASQLDACTGGYCVPDPLIRSGGAKPPSCKSLSGAAGVCMSLCIPQVAMYKTLLPQDVCAADERCAPCISPLDGTETGVCKIGTNTCGGSGGGDPGGGGPPPPPVCPHVGPPVIDPTTLPACGMGGAHCISSALVPAAMQSQLAACPTGLCAPDVFIASGGQFIPPSCDSLDGAEGRCLNVVIPQVAAEQAQLTQSTCAAYERCVPCYSPLDGTETGACKLSCDPGATKPKVLFQDCCDQHGTTAGKCVPSEVIPQSEQQNLGNDVCSQGSDLCVPTEMLQASFMPPTCSATGFLVGNYTGVCLSDCLKFGLQGIVLARGNCPQDHKCAPCKNPLTGQATGAPGCPP
jgi:hypothetical protein